RARGRVPDQDQVTWELGSVDAGFGGPAGFDLIVAAEVLYYLPDVDSLRRALDNLAGRLAPGGLLVFGSAVDGACARWGLSVGGAESTMREWDLRLREIGRAALTGADWGEDCRIVSYTRDAARPEG
ncbi:MAG: SAM-dependent methyltransferase, partial [Phenylobacterium sp.]